MEAKLSRVLSDRDVIEYYLQKYPVETENYLSTISEKKGLLLKYLQSLWSKPSSRIQLSEYSVPRECFAHLPTTEYVPLGYGTKGKVYALKDTNKVIKAVPIDVNIPQFGNGKSPLSEEQKHYHRVTRDESLREGKMATIMGKLQSVFL